MLLYWVTVEGSVHACTNENLVKWSSDGQQLRRGSHDAPSLPKSLLVATATPNTILDSCQNLV